MPAQAVAANDIPAAALRPHYPSLDGLRAVAVFLLFFQHSGFSTGMQFRDGFRWMGHMEIAPTTFFVLSAFLLYQPFVAAHLTGRGAPRWTTFLRGRALRVIPLYWVSLTLLILFFRAPSVTGSVPGMKVDGWADAFALYTFTQIYVPSSFFHGIPQAYTLNVEVAFYAFLPAFAWAMCRATGGRSLAQKVRIELLALGAVAVVALCWRMAIEILYEDDLRACVDSSNARLACAAVKWLPGYLDYFAVGMALAVVVTWRTLSGADPSLLRWTARHGDLLFVAAVVGWLVYSTQLGTDPGLGEYISPARAQARHYLALAIVVLAMTPSVFGPHGGGGWRRFLRWRPVAFAGLISYGIYLWHQGWTDKAIGWTDIEDVPVRFVVVLGIAVVLSCLTATVGHYGIERPITRRRNRPLREWLRPVAGPRSAGPADATTTVPPP